MSPQRPRLQRLPSLNSSSTSYAPPTPPPMYAPNIMDSPTSTFTPLSPTTPSTPMREIIMGGLVSRPTTPRTPGGEFWEEYDEKRQASIEVPGIILTEPLPDLPPRSPSPPATSILLLPPASLPLPDFSSSSISSQRPFFPAFASIINGRKGMGAGTVTIRSVIILGAIALGAWHLYTTFDMGTLVEDVMSEGI